MLKGLSFPNIGSRKVFTTSSRVTISSPLEKKNVWREGDQCRTKCLNPLTSWKPSRFLVLATDFRTPTHSRHPTKSASLNSLSTYSAQPMILPATKSRKMGTTSQDPHLIWRSNISFGSGTCAELTNKLIFWAKARYEFFFFPTLVIFLKNISSVKKRNRKCGHPTYLNSTHYSIGSSAQ